MKANGLAALAARRGLYLGTVYSAASLGRGEYLAMLEGDFNSLTPANELKAYALLDRAASQRRGDIALDFTKADALLDYARRNGFAVRGHTLVWDAFMPDWFFREGCREAGDYLPSGAQRARLQRYIDQVLTHCERAFPGVIYAWDVVNEAVADSPEECRAGDPRRVRVTRGGARNPFCALVGEDYVEFSFLCAADALCRLRSGARLIYNDYNAFRPDKREAIRCLARSVNAYAKDADGGARRLLDGVGMQGYLGGFGQQEGCLDEGDLALVCEAVRRYSDSGLEVQITEAALRNYQNDHDTAARHAAYCGAFFGAVLDLADGSTRLTGVSVWGVCDHPGAAPDSYGYRMNGPYCGLFDERCQPKAAYEAARRALAK